MNVYYGTLHFIITAGLLVWVYLRRHQHYRQYRNLLGMTTALALIGYFAFPLAPPRMTPCHDCFVDTLDTIGGLWSYHSSAAKAIANPFAAMPSLHFGWALWCGTLLWSFARNPFVRSFSVIYPAMTLLAIVVTANHYWLDAVGGAIIFFAASYTLRYLRRSGATQGRRRSARRSAACRRADSPACSPLSMRATSSTRSAPSTMPRRGGRDVLGDMLADHDLAVGERRDLGEVRDAHDLMTPPQTGERLGDRCCRRPADAGIDLVEHECLWGLGQHQAQGQHRACQFAAARDPRQRQQRQTRVGRDQERHVVAGGLVADRDLHLGVWHRQRSDHFANGSGKVRRAGPAHLQRLAAQRRVRRARRLRGRVSRAATRCS